jgi:uncharacterized hydrophobic protein (TIGR00271 family)
MKQARFFFRLLDFINLEHEVDDFNRIHETIEKDLSFKGSNIWILAFATIIASVGLNMNSTAVIIGAMLISPLMGPINGMGYSIATYNFPLLQKSIRNFTFSVLASLFASTVYFFLSPISTAHSELLARTSPTIYDVIIALFGGLAGIVAISSKQKGNVIPGVAIATALMPPLCTAGYGLATGQLNYFFGAFFLFTINAVFIAISSVIISQILKFPIRTLVDNAKKKRINQITSIIMAIVLIPSIYFGYDLVQKERFSENAKKYINNVTVVEGNILLRSEIKPNNRSIILVYGGEPLSEDQKISILEKTADFSLKKAKVEFIQGLSLGQTHSDKSEVEDLKLEITRLNMKLQNKEQALDSIDQRNLKGKQIFGEIKTLYPQIVNCSYAQSFVFSNSDTTPEKVEIVILNIGKNSLRVSERKKIESWLKTRLNSEQVKVVFEN